MEELNLDVMCNVPNLGNVETVVEPNCDDKVLVPNARQRRSDVWNHFNKEEVNGVEKAICKYCNASYNGDSKTGTSNLKKHILKCKSYLEKQGTNKHFDPLIYRDLVARAIIRHGYAFSWVEHESNKDIHFYLNNQVQTISRNTAKADCLKLHSDLKQKLKATLSSTCGRICLTSDLWTSCQTKGYMSLTVHYVDNDWKLQSKVLNFHHVPPPHSGAVLYDTVYGLLRDWGIENKIFSITLDNASSNFSLQDRLVERLHSQGALVCFGRYFHVRCAAHILNLIVQDSLKVINGCIVKVRESVKYVEGSEARMLRFKECALRANSGQTCSLWLDVPTRWNSTYMMLQRALLYRTAFMELARVDSSYSSCPSPLDWEKIAKIKSLLEPFSEISDLFSGSHYPTANLYFFYIWNIDMLVKEESENIDDEIRKMAESMRKKFDKYWSDYCPLFVFAVILDPRRKDSFVKNCYTRLYGDAEKAKERVKQLLDELKSLYSEYADDEPYSTASYVPESNEVPLFPISQLNSKRKYRDLIAHLNEETSSTRKTMLEVYLEHPKVLGQEDEFDILAFWKDNQQVYGKLCSLARDILSVPLTTVASESSFSVGSCVLNKWRSKLLPENVEVLITTRCWLFGYETHDKSEEKLTGSNVEWMNTRSPPSTQDI